MAVEAGGRMSIKVHRIWLQQPKGIMRETELEEAISKAADGREVIGFTCERPNKVYTLITRVN